MAMTVNSQRAENILTFCPPSKTLSFLSIDHALFINIFGQNLQMIIHIPIGCMILWIPFQLQKISHYIWDIHYAYFSNK